MKDLLKLDLGNDSRTIKLLGLLRLETVVIENSRNMNYSSYIKSSRKPHRIYPNSQFLRLFLMPFLSRKLTTQILTIANLQSLNYSEFVPFADQQSLNINKRFHMLVYANPRLH